MNINDSVVFITGANRGIGKAYAEELLKFGVKKIYLAVRRPETAKEIEEEDPKRIVTIKLDMTNPADIENAARQCTDVDLIISNAGVLKGGSVKDDDIVENAREEMEVNYFGPLALMNAFAPVLEKNGGGAIVCVDSIAGLIPFPAIATYCASKFAMHALIMQARMELAGQGTKVFGVYPGPIDTDMARNIDLPKVPPRHVAIETIKAIREEQEDIMPDPYSQEAYVSYKHDPKGAEMEMRRQYAEMMKKAVKAA